MSTTHPEFWTYQFFVFQTVANYVFLVKKWTVIWIVSQLISSVFSFISVVLQWNFSISYGLLGFLWQKLCFKKCQLIWNNWTPSEMSWDRTNLVISSVFVYFDVYLKLLRRRKNKYHKKMVDYELKIVRWHLFDNKTEQDTKTTGKTLKIYCVLLLNKTNKLPLTVQVSGIIT